MSRAVTLLLLSCVACVSACTVPTIEELESKSPAGCNDTDHPCPSGAVCFDNRCIFTEGLACVPGTSLDCGSNVGECAMGKSLCGADGTYGACENAVTPVREVCGDGKDNDCDGQTDTWSGPLALTQTQDLGSSVAAVTVRRTSDGKNDNLIALTTESGGLVVHTLARDGSVKQGRTISPPATNVAYKLPALVADGDTVAAAWVEQTSPSGPVTSKVRWTLLDGLGNSTTPTVLDLSYGTATVARVQLAINPTHVLLLVTTTTGSNAVTDAYTVPRADFKSGSVNSLKSMGSTSAEGLWAHAAPNGKGDSFLVAYSNLGTRAVTVLTNDCKLDTSAPVTITTKTANHSPFIVPIKDSPKGFTLYYVQNPIDTTQPAQILSMGCLAATCSSKVLVALNTSSSTINTLGVAARPGELPPDAALWTVKNGSSEGGRFVGTFDASGGGLPGLSKMKELPVTDSPLLSQALVVMPDSTRYLAYQQSPASPPPGSATNSEAYLLPFCGP